jgi:hypothetical protein
VDTWKKDADGKWEKTGIASFSFGVDDMNKVQFPDQSSWLGWSDWVVTLFGTQLGKGKFMKGHIYSSTFNPKMVVSTLHTTPEEDQEFLKYMQKRLGTTDRYSVGWLNCVNYTNHEFGGAKNRFHFK